MGAIRIPADLVLPTASKVDLADACPPAFAIPGVAWSSDDASRGSIIHGYIKRAREAGKEAALAEILDDDLRAVCDGIDLEALPAGAESEIAFAWDWDADEAEVVKLAQPRAYPAAARWFFGTADLVGRAGDGVFVGDFKTGVMKTRAKESMQLRALALFAARAAGVDEAQVMMLYLRHDGKWAPDRASFDACELDDIAEQLRGIVDRIAAARALVEAGKVPEFHAGPHCRYCPGLAYCPAQKALVRMVVPDMVRVEDKLAKLTPEEQGEAWEQLKMGEVVFKRIKEVLQNLARQNPIPLPGGRELREVPWSTREVQRDQAVAILRKSYGDDIARESLEISLSSIERGFKAAGRRPKEGKEAIAALEAAGAIVKAQTTQVRAVAAK